MTMLPSRKVAATFAGVFLIGALVGGFVESTFHDVRLTHFFDSTTDPKKWAAKINQKYIHEYGLTPDEQARVAPIIQEMTQRLYLFRRQFGVDIVTTLDDYHAKIGEQMLPAHREVYEKANVTRKKRMTTMLRLDSDSPVSGSDSK